MEKIEYYWYMIYGLLKRDIPNFIKNIWVFRRALWKHRWYDYRGTLEFIKIGLTDISNNIEKYGYETDDSRFKKIKAMRRAIEIIKNYNDDNYINMAEKELGNLILNGFGFEPSDNHPDCFVLVDKDTPEEKEHNRKIFKRSNELEEQEWNELMYILKGQDYSKFDGDVDFDKQFDGSGMRGWWD
jgi:hypothetical protein